MGGSVNKLKTTFPHALIIAAAALLIFCTLNTGHNWGGDFASYIMQAKSLVDTSPHEFIQANQFTIEQTTHTLAPVAYPWGFPAMLAPVYAAFGQNIFALKLVAASCYLLLLVLLAVGFRKHHPGIWLLCLVALFAVNPTLLTFLNMISSDIPFMFVSTLCVLLIGRYAVYRKHIISPTMDGLILGLLIAAACFIRTNGILLLATLAITQLLASPLFARKIQPKDQPPKPRPWLYAFPYITFFTAILLGRAALPSGESAHMDYLRLITPGGIMYHLTYYGTLPKDFYAGIPYPLLVYLLTLPLAFIGAIHRRRTDHYIFVYIALTYLLYVLWPVTQALRFLFPILPFYISFVLSGLQVLQANKKIGRTKLRQTLCALPIVLIFIGFTATSISNARDNLNRNRATPAGPYTQPASEMFTFIKDSTDPDSTLMFYKPRVMRMMTGRKSYSTRETKGLAPADYIIMSMQTKERQLPPDAAEQLAQQGLAESIFENTAFRIYRITKPINNQPGTD